MNAQSITVTDEPTLLVAAESYNRVVYVTQTTNDTFWVGGANVAITNGFPFAKHQEPQEIVLPANTPLYGIVGDDDEVEVRVMTPPLD